MAEASSGKEKKNKLGGYILGTVHIHTALCILGITSCTISGATNVANRKNCLGGQKNPYYELMSVSAVAQLRGSGFSSVLLVWYTYQVRYVLKACG